MVQWSDDFLSPTVKIRTTVLKINLVVVLIFALLMSNRPVL